ncbi:MAG TPA: lysylphosphatidylglycerol synthase transmembrane domain-containing protein [Pyrinomonadaceae bacterium]|nr:lysylphosphatidylglycerol synthase transmembrane domain-containing protein [Pyrinomonadaceae bacterium]
MTQESTKTPSRKGLTPFGIISFVLGLALFGYFVKKAGISQILEGISRLGAGFLLVVAISALRQIARSIAWTLCMEPPYRLRFRDAIRARIMGDAIGNILPFAGFLVSEPAKPALIRDRVPLMAGFSALAIENIFYALSVALFICSGMLALLLSFTLPKGLRLISMITLAVIAVVIALGAVLIGKRLRFISGGARFLHRRGLNEKWIEKGSSLEDRVYGFYQRNSARFLPILLLEGCFHLAGVTEIYVTLSFISPDQPPTFLTAFILESVNRVITVAFKFIPLRMGVDEAGTGRVSKILQFTMVTGVTLAIVRKARDVFWAATGMILLLQRGLSLRAVARDAEAALAEEAKLRVPSNLPASESS